MSPVVTCTWAGRPSRIAVSEGPWDSPAVSQRSMAPVFHAPGGRFHAPGGRPNGTQVVPSVPETSRQPRSDQYGEQRAGEHRGARGDARAQAPPHASHDEAADRTDEQDENQAHHHLRPAQVTPVSYTHLTLPTIYS